MEGAEKNTDQKNDKKKSRVKLIYIIVAVLCLPVLALGCFYVYQHLELAGKQSPPEPTEKLEEDPAAGEYQPPDEDTEEDGIAIPGWGKLYLDANETRATVDFYNPKENAGQYYLTFELRLPDPQDGSSYEVLYKSGLVKPDLHIQQIQLSRPLEAGTYDAIIHVQPYRMDDQQTPTNNADMKTVLIVA